MTESMNTCPRCGGETNEGEIRLDSDVLTGGQMSPLMSGLTTGTYPRMMESGTSCPSWVEKTGKKTGFIIKTDETIRLKVKGRRCPLCGYIELYAL